MELHVLAKRVESTSQAHEDALGPDSRDREARMRSLVLAAVALFSEEGYGPVSTRRIAETAGCSETLVFRYFGGKRGLLTAISKELLQQTHDDPLALPRYDDLREYIESYLLGCFQRMESRAGAIKVIISALVTEPDLVTAFERRHDEQVRTVSRELSRFQETSAIAPHFDVADIAAGIEQMGFSVGFLLQIVYKRPVEELASIASAMALALSQGLQGERPPLPLPEAMRKDTLGVAHGAAERLDRVVALLDTWKSSAGADSKPA